MAAASQKSAVLFDLAKIIDQQNDFQEILRLISSTAAALFNAEVASIMMISPGTQETVRTIFKGGKDLAATRAGLGEQAFVAEYETGKMMTVEKAIAYVLNEAGTLQRDVENQNSK